jgi:hypothetical protein
MGNPDFLAEPSLAGAPDYRAMSGSRPRNFAAWIAAVVGAVPAVLAAHNTGCVAVAGPVDAGFLLAKIVLCAAIRVLFFDGCHSCRLQQAASKRVSVPPISELSLVLPQP